LAVTDHYTPLLPDFLRAPRLNEELLAHLPVEAKNREKFLKQAQKDLGLVLTPLGIALSMVTAEIDFPNKFGLMECLADAGKLITDVIHQLSLSRRFLVIPKVEDKRYREILTSAALGTFLFGSDLAERIKNMKAVTTTGLEICLTTAPPSKEFFRFGKWVQPAAGFTTRRYVAGSSIKRLLPSTTVRRIQSVPAEIQSKAKHVTPPFRSTRSGECSAHQAISNHLEEVAQAGFKAGTVA